MIPNEGLISTFAGQMAIVAGLIVVGFLVGYLPVMGFIVARYKPQGRTQTNMLTGMTEQSIHWWAVRVACFTMGGQVLFGIVLTAMAAVDWLNTHAPLWWVAGMLAAVSVGCLLVYRRFRVPRREYHDEPAPAAEPDPEPVGWSLPPEMPQWDGR